MSDESHKKVIRYFQKKGNNASLIINESVAISHKLPARVPHLSKIVELGLGPEVVRLRRMGMPAWEIAEKIGQTKHQVQHFIRQYNKLNPEDRSMVNTRNIYDLAERLRDKLEDYENMLAGAQGLDGGVPNPELELKIHGNELNVYKLLGELVERLEVMKKKDRFQEIVLDVLNRKSPGIKAECIKALAEQQDAISMLRPY